MQLIAKNRVACQVNRPFSGNLGVRLYAGLGSPAAIRYRVNQIFARHLLNLSPLPSNDVALGTGPTSPLAVTFPSSWFGRNDIWLQLRTFANDFENDSIYRPVNISLDSNGNTSVILSGSVTVIDVTPKANGQADVQFVWTPAQGSVTPDGFQTVVVSGPNAPSQGLWTLQNQRVQKDTLTGLVVGTYSFRMDAVSGSVAVTVATFAVTISQVPTSTVSLSIVGD